MIYIIYLSIPIISFILLKQYFLFANKKSILDEPKENRSIHKAVTPTGAGIIIILNGLVFSSFILYFFYNKNISIAFSFCILFLVLISFVDDLISLSIKVRILSYIFVVIGLMFSYEGQSLISNFNLWKFFLFFMSLWFLNLYNFMDNSDLTLYTNYISFSVIIIVIGIFGIIQIDYHNKVIIICFFLSLLPYVYFNKPIAKMFLGDSGSITLAFIALWLIFYFYKISNYYVIAIFSTFFIDTTFTLLKRILKKENIFKAHKQHLNQVYIERNGIDKFVKINLITHLLLIVTIIYSQFYRLEYILFLIIVLIINIIYFFIINVRVVKTL